MQRDRPDASAPLTVRYSRKKNLAGGLLLTAIMGPGCARAAWTGNIGLPLLLSPFVLMGLVFLMQAIRAAPQLLIDSTGLRFCPADAHINWAEIATLEIQEWQGNYDLRHRLVLRAVHPQRFDETWRHVPRRPWIARPCDGHLSLPLDLLSPSSRRLANAIREYSAGQFSPQLRRVSHRPFRDPDSV